jgi:hypothetical protein
VEYFGITPGGRMEIAGSVQVIKNGKYSPVQMWYWWFHTEEAFNLFKAQQPALENVTLEFLKFEKEQ